MSSLKKNIFYNMFYQILLLIIPFVVTPYISRVIGVDGIGAYSYTYSIVQYCALFVMLGLNNYGNRMIAKSRNNKKNLSNNFWNIYYMQLICFFVVSIFFVLYLLFGAGEYKRLFVIEYVFILSAAFDINWFFFGIEKFKKIVIRNLILKLLTLASIFIFVKDTDGLFIYTVIMALSTLFTNIVLWPYIFKRLFFVLPNFKEIKCHFKGNLVLFVPVLAISIYNIMDKVMIGGFVGVGDVGLYESAEKIINIPLNIMTAVGTVMMPRISAMLSVGKEARAKQLTKRVFIMSMFFAFPMALGLFGIADNLIVLYLGSEFSGSIIFVKLLCIIIIFKVLGNIIRTQHLIPYEKDKIYIKSVVGGAVVNFISNIILIFIYGAIGAVIGTICAEIFVATYQTIAIKNTIDIKNAVREVLPFLFKSFVLLIVVFSIDFVNIDSIFFKCLLQVVLGALVYLLLNIKFIKNNLVILKSDKRKNIISTKAEFKK